MINIFISYRRADSQEITDRLHDQMGAHFGEDNVFQDVLDIPFGVDFRRYIRESVAKCQVVLVVIGPDWARLLDERRDSPDDFVRLEIETALQLGKLVVPVTVRGAAMPPPEALPESIRALCWLNRAVVRPNPDFKRDCERLAHGIKQAVDGAATLELPTVAAVGLAEARAASFGASGGRNADWTPFISTLDGLALPDMAFCLVPTGRFMMGSGDYSDEKPPHAQTFAQPYWIAQTPVTNAQWAAAVRAGAVSLPVGEKALSWFRDPALAGAPVVGVTWGMAQGFAAWLGARLPTEREWEYAARGPDGWAYPWGEHFDAARVVYKHNSGGRPWPVEWQPGGASWVGALHLAGNVWEWTASVYAPYPYPADGSREAVTGAPVLRGGSWASDQRDTRAAFRVKAVSDDWFISVDGFRCALSVGG